MARIVDSLIPEMEQEAQSTRRMLERVPANKLGWKPHVKSMSLGQLALHVATIPGTLAQIFDNDTFEMPNFEEPSPVSAAELVPALDESIRTAKQILGKMDDSKVMGTWKMVQNGKEIMAGPRVAFLRPFLLSHWYHHRGQLSVYLRLLDVPLPTVYGPTADENPFAPK